MKSTPRRHSPVFAAILAPCLVACGAADDGSVPSYESPNEVATGEASQAAIVPDSSCGRYTAREEGSGFEPTQSAALSACWSDADAALRYGDGCCSVQHQDSRCAYMQADKVNGYPAYWVCGC